MIVVIFAAAEGVKYVVKTFGRTRLWFEFARVWKEEAGEVEGKNQHDRKRLVVSIETGHSCYCLE